jgi:nitrogen fixation/metabolism regulation signal transduction histidine kinase
MSSPLFDPYNEALNQETRVFFLLLAAAILLSFALTFIYDAMKFAHRVVGPVYRLRKAVQAIAAGEAVEMVTLRKGDYLQDVKDDFNEMLKVLEERGAIVVKNETAKEKEARPLSV